MQVMTRHHSKSAGRAPVPVPGRTSFKAADAARNAAVFQVVWTVWAGGRRFYVVFHMVRLRTCMCCYQSFCTQRRLAALTGEVDKITPGFACLLVRRVFPSRTALYEGKGREYIQCETHVVFVVAQTKSHSLARVSINGVELLRRSYKLWQQVGQP